MPMTEYGGNTEVITGIGTTPQERGLTADQFKAKFDEGLKAFVAWFNTTHKIEFDTQQSYAENYAIFRLSANQTISNNTETQLNFNTNVEINTSLYALDSGQIKVLKDGTYQVIAFIVFAANVTGYRAANIDRVLGVANLRDYMRVQIPAIASSSVTTEFQVVFTTKLTADQKVKVSVQQDSGSNLDVLGGFLYTTKVLIRKI